MNKVAIIIISLILAMAVGLSGCATPKPPTAEPQPIPEAPQEEVASPPPEAPETPAPPEEEEEAPPEAPPEEAAPPMPAPKPLEYEILDSYIEEDTIRERHQLVIGGEVIQDEVVEVSIPIGCVTLQNTGTVSGTFVVSFSFYALDKFTAETYKEVFGELDEAMIRMMGDEYTHSIRLELEPNEADTARYTIYDINMDEDEWFWEYEVTPSGKGK